MKMNYFRLFNFLILIISTSQNGDVKHKYIPKMVAFDLDFTLWPSWVDVDSIPPFVYDSVGDVVDNNGKQVKPYKEVTQVFKYLKDNQIKIGVFSSSYDIDGSKQLLELFKWTKYFSNVKIYDGHAKHTYVNATNLDTFCIETGIKLKDILFVDDVHINIDAFTHLEGISYFAYKGVSMDEMMIALKHYSDENEKLSKKL